jgi:hypothetical protein
MDGLHSRQDVLFITIKLLDFVHRPDFYKQKTQRFGNWICFRLQAKGRGHLFYRKTKACLSTGDARTKEGQPSPSPSPSQFTTDSPSVSMSWCRAPSGAHDQIVIDCLTVAVLSCTCALSYERSGLSFVSHSPKSSSISTWTIYIFHVSHV